MQNRVYIVESFIVKSAIKTGKDKHFTYVLYYTNNTAHKIMLVNFLFVFLFKYIYIYIYIYIHILYIYIHTHTYIYVYIYAQAYVRLHIAVTNEPKECSTVMN